MVKGSTEVTEKTRSYTEKMFNHSVELCETSVELSVILLKIRRDLW